MLCLECFLVCVLALPVTRKIKSEFVQWISKAIGTSSLWFWARTVAIVLLLLLVSSVLHVTQVRSDAKLGVMSGENLIMAQRDFYLVLATFSLFVALQGTFEYLLELYRMEVNNTALERQAKYVSASYEALLDEKIQVEKKIRNFDSRRGKSEMEEDNSKVAELESQLKGVKKQLEESQSELNGLKKANQQLRNQLDDYDFMYGDQRKKNQ